jgi:hypothetical protein
MGEQAIGHRFTAGAQRIDGAAQATGQSVNSSNR